MKKIIGILLSIIFIFLLISENIYATVYVKGYFRSDGTYVAPYTRNEPKKNINFLESEYKKNNSNTKDNKYYFYKTQYLKSKKEKTISQYEYIKIKEKEIYEKSIKRENEIREKQEKEEKRKLELEWKSKMDKNIKEYQKKQKSIEFLNKGMKLAKKSLCKNTEECIDAIFFYKKSLDINNRKDVSDSLDDLYLMLAAQYNKQSKYNNAIKYILLSKKSTNKKMANSLLSDSYNGLAKDYYNNGEYNDAIEYGLLASKKGKENIWYSYYVIGLSYFELKEYKSALFYFEESLKNTDNKENIKSLNDNIRLSNKKINEVEKIGDDLIKGIVSNKENVQNLNNNIKRKAFHDFDSLVGGNGCGDNTTYIKKTDECICNKGYKWGNDEGVYCIEDKKIKKEEINLCGKNSIIDGNNKNDCICKEGYEWETETGLDCKKIEKQSSIYRKKLDKKILIKLDKILPKILNKPEKQLIKLNKKIDILLKKKLNTKTKNIILYLKYSIEEKLDENIDLEELLK